MLSFSASAALADFPSSAAKRGAFIDFQGWRTEAVSRSARLTAFRQPISNHKEVET